MYVDKYMYKIDHLETMLYPMRGKATATEWMQSQF